MDFNFTLSLTWMLPYAGMLFRNWISGKTWVELIGDPQHRRMAVFNRAKSHSGTQFKKLPPSSLELKETRKTTANYRMPTFHSLYTP